MVAASGPAWQWEDAWGGGGGGGAVFQFNDMIYDMADEMFFSAYTPENV